MADKQDTRNNYRQSAAQDKDNLMLSEIGPPRIPSDILFPEELNKYLRNEIQTLTRENAKLTNSLAEKETIIKNKDLKLNEINDKVKQYEHFTGSASAALSGRTSDLAGSKIVELSKKIRELTSELEACKTRCSKLDCALKRHRAESEQLIKDVDPARDEKEENESAADSGDQVKILNDKLTSVSNKLFEARNQNTQLKNEIKLANKLLAQEIGDGFISIQKFNGSNTNWRGRAQQILALQQKLAEYQDKMSVCNNDKESNTATILRQMEANRRQIQEQLAKDLSATKIQLNETRSKLDGSRARTKVLETECCNLKSKVVTLLDKSAHDDQLIKALTGQTEAIEQKYKDERNEVKLQFKKLEYENQNLKTELEMEKQKRDALQKLLDDRSRKIEALLEQAKRKQYENNMDDDQKIINDKQEINTRNENHVEAVLKLAETEKNSLMELIAKLDARLEAERNAHDVTKLQLKKELQRNSKYEAKINKLELEQKMSKSYLYSRSSKSLLSTQSGNKLDVEMEELKNRLELSEEQILLYKTRLETIQQEKKSDLDHFNSSLTSIQEKISKEFALKIQ